MPLTPVEWWVGSTLQLVAGVMWAYVIGGLVAVAASADPVNEVYRYRIDQANELIKEFYPKQENENDDYHRSDEITSTAKSIRRYLLDQKEKCRNAGFASNLIRRFPVVEFFTPQLQRMSSLLTARNHLEAIPYISSQYLSRTEQSYLAEKCTILAYSNGEKLEITNDGIENLGRGVLLITEGCVSRVRKQNGEVWARLKLAIGRGVIGEDVVLVEKSNKALEHTVDHVYFLSYTKLIFIPRDAIMDAFSRNQAAWKDCARWKYLKILFLFKYVNNSKKDTWSKK